MVFVAVKSPRTKLFLVYFNINQTTVQQPFKNRIARVPHTTPLSGLLHARLYSEFLTKPGNSEMLILPSFFTRMKDLISFQVPSVFVYA